MVSGCKRDKETAVVSLVFLCIYCSFYPTSIKASTVIILLAVCLIIISLSAVVKGHQLKISQFATDTSLMCQVVVKSYTEYILLAQINLLQCKYM